MSRLKLRFARVRKSKKRKGSLFSFSSESLDFKTTTQEGQLWRKAFDPVSDSHALAELSTPRPSRLFIVAALVVIGLFAGLTYRLVQLQVVEAARYEELANGNRIRERITYAQRGRILDRNGRVLAENTLTFQLTLTPYLMTDDSSREVGYARIASVIDVPVTELRELAATEGGSYPLPLLVREDIPHKQAIALKQILPEASGFSLDEVPTRVYDARIGLAHLLGYVGRVSPDELHASSELLPVDFVGKSGLEKSYDAQLRGSNGRERTEVDALGRPVRLLAQQDAQAGTDITLTIDYDLQQRLHDAILKQMKESKTTKASGVVLDPDTGAVLAMVSIPYYDNNQFIGGISSGDFNALQDDPDRPLINRVVQAGYSSGSVIKPVVASGALKHGVVAPETVIVDSGSITVPSNNGTPFVFRGWRPEGLGPMNVRSAIAWSSNIYFYTVGGGHAGIEGLGEERLTSLYRDFGLGSVTGLDLPIEYSGRVPDSAFKQSLSGEPWFIGDSYNISIGQGDLLVTPLQLSVADMAIANNGYLLQPQLVKNVGSVEVLRRVVRNEVPVSKDILQIVREGMRQVLTNGTTCDCVFKDISQEVAGKSGTAQTTSDDSRRPHAWFTAFAPWQDPEIYATVMIEEGSGGSQYSAPVIAEVFDQYFNK